MPPPSPRLRRLALGAVCAGALVATVFFHAYASQRGQVFVASQCDSNGEFVGEIMHEGAPLCVALVLDDALPAADGVELTVEHDGGDGRVVTASHAWHTAAFNDQIVFQVKDARILSAGQTGDFVATYRIGGEVAGERAFKVAAAGAP